MAYFFADDFINFLEKEKIFSLKSSTFWELLTNEQFLNLVESYEKKCLFSVLTSEGLKQLYNIFYKQKIKVRDGAFSCSNKEILECLKYYMKYFATRPKSSNTAPLVIRKNNYSNNLDTDSKNVISDQIKNTSKFTSALERLKSIAKEKQVLKTVDDQVNSPVPSVPVSAVSEENREETKKEEQEEEKPKAKTSTFDDDFYKYLLKKYNSEDEALNLLLGYKLCKIFTNRHNKLNPDKKINYNTNIEFQEFSDDNFGIPKKSLFDYVAFKKLNSDNNSTKPVKAKSETKEQVETATTESVEPIEAKAEITEQVETSAELVENKEEANKKITLQEIDNAFLLNCESLLPTKFYFYDEIVDVKNWKELYISIAKQFAEKFHDNLFSECNAGKGLLYDSILDIGLLPDSLIEPVQICDDLFLMTAEKFNRNVKIYLRKIKKLAEICEADFEKIVIYFL